MSSDLSRPCPVWVCLFCCPVLYEVIIIRAWHAPRFWYCVQYVQYVLGLRLRTVQYSMKKSIAADTIRDDGAL